MADKETQTHWISHTDKKKRISREKWERIRSSVLSRIKPESTNKDDAWRDEKHAGDKKRKGKQERSKRKDNKQRKSNDLMLNVISKIDEINTLLKNNGIGAVAIPGGSVAKGTHLKDDFDVDIFVKFSQEYRNEDISSLLGKALKPMIPQKVHGSRDYYNIDIGIKYEIIPVLDISSPHEAMNVTDMSPMHVMWVKEHIKKNKGLDDEIRLAKQFCKAAGAYGAESFIGGFSGHVLDILVSYYGDFLSFIIKMSEMKQGTVIDVMNYHRGQAFNNLNKSKLLSPIIVIDPILPDRNAAAALSEKKFLKLKKASNDFLNNPSASFFVVSNIDLKKVRDQPKGKKAFIFKAKPLKGKTDVIGSKLLKAFEHIRSMILMNDFTLYDHDWEWDKKNDAIFWFILKDETLDAKKEIQGPPISEKKHAESFRKKHPDAFIKKGKLYAFIKRDFIKAEELFKSSIKEEYVSKRVKQIHII